MLQLPSSRATTFVASLLALSAGPVFSAGAPDAIRRSLQQNYPQVRVIDVLPSPIDGVFEVFTGDSIAYTDASGKFLIVGQMMDTTSKKNLTSERIDDLNRVDLKRLPLDRSIRFVKGDGSRKLFVFSDPDCPYCQALEKDLAGLDNLTVHILLFPLASIHPEAKAKARAIWCSSDRAAAWQGWMLERRDPGKSECAGDPVETTIALGRELRVVSTPTLVFQDGRRFTGAPNAAKLEELLNAAAGASSPQR